MTEVTRITLENEMDVVVAHKRMMSVAQFFSLTLSTQTTIATAVAEVSRVIVDKTDSGQLVISMQKSEGKFFLTGRISFPADIEIRLSEEGLKYAQVLVPEFSYVKTDDSASITVSIGIPRSFKITAGDIRAAADFFQTIEPTSPYEKLKLRNTLLNRQALEKEEELRNNRLLDEKKNEFISIASHELKTPLTSIMAFTKLALSAGDADASPKVMRYIEKIDKQVRKLHLLIQQLLDISKIESGKLDYNMQVSEWNAYMSDIAPILEHMVPSHKLSWSSCAESVFVNMDSLRIEQVLTNLVGNAAKYSEPATMTI